jgi:DNA-nicking Smr family endonuclease
VDELRRRADKAFQAQKILLAAYQAAEAEAGGRASAKSASLLAQAREMGAKAKALVDEANAAAWRAHNRLIRNTWEIDLHLMGAKPAMEKLMQQLTLIKAMDSPGGVLVRVITGRGRHSADGVPAIRNRVTAYLQDGEFDHSIDPDNPGVVLVHVGGKSTGGEAGQEH